MSADQIVIEIAELEVPTLVIIAHDDPPYVLIQLADEDGMSWVITCGNGTSREGLGFVLQTLAETLGTDPPASP